MSTMNTFSIEDAFEDDDQMRVYGPTTENIPLASKKCTKQSNSSFSAPVFNYLYINIYIYIYIVTIQYLNNN